MSEQSTVTNHPSGRDRVRARLSSFSRSREQRMLGPAEMIGLAGSALILLLVVVSYLYFLLPANSRLAALQSERALLQARLRDSQHAVSEGLTTEATVQKITESLVTFESDHLANANRGRMSLYDSLNSLIHNNGLRNTAGPTDAALEPFGSKTSTGGTKSNTKWQSVYPGIAIGLTVEGQYPNLRRFVQDLETNKQFVIINSVELERSTENNKSPVTEELPAGTANPAAIVSLRLEMATYFQRSSAGDTGNNAPER